MAGYEQFDIDRDGAQGIAHVMGYGVGHRL
jgi:hypothetical protein